MAKFEFKKDTKKEARKPRPVKKTEISKPQETYDPLKTTQKVEKDLETKVEKRRVGRPKTGRKSYQTVRLQKSTVIKINPLENALGITTQDQTGAQVRNSVINNLTTDERRGYNLWLDMFKKKDKG